MDDNYLKMQWCTGRKGKRRRRLFKNTIIHGKNKKPNDICLKYSGVQKKLKTTTIIMDKFYDFRANYTFIAKNEACSISIKLVCSQLCGNQTQLQSVTIAIKPITIKLIVMSLLLGQLCTLFDMFDLQQVPLNFYLSNNKDDIVETLEYCLHIPQALRTKTNKLP